MEHLYTRKKCTRCTRVARRGGRSVRGAREPVWANSLRIAKDVTRFSSYKEQKRRASETARVLSRVRTKSDPSSEAKTHSEQSRKNTRFATFFSWGSRTGVNARPRRRAVRCLRPRPTPRGGVGLIELPEQQAGVGAARGEAIRRRRAALCGGQRVEGVEGHLAVEKSESPTLGRPEAGSRGHGEPPGCSGSALGCVGAARASRWSREADGAVSSDRMEAVSNQLKYEPKRTSTFSVVGSRS